MSDNGAYYKVPEKEDEMRFITIRDLRSKSAQIQRELPKEKEMVLTSNGKPIAILTATSADRIEESLAMIRQVRATKAVEYMQRRSVEAGTDRIRSRRLIKRLLLYERADRQDESSLRYKCSGIWVNFALWCTR